MLFAVLEAKRFDKVRQTQELTIQYWISYRYWQISDYRNIGQGPYRCITRFEARVQLVYSCCHHTIHSSSLQERFMSLEKEVFPFMAQDAELFAFDLEGENAVIPTADVCVHAE